MMVEQLPEPKSSCGHNQNLGQAFFYPLPDLNDMSEVHSLKSEEFGIQSPRVSFYHFQCYKRNSILSVVHYSLRR